MLRQYENQYHRRNLYLDFDLEDAAQLSQFVRETSRTLQVMLPSVEQEKIAILQDLGFTLRRRCHLMEVSAAAYLGETTFGPLNCAERGDEAYLRCAEHLFQHYCTTHQAINPWTADFEAFAKQLPEMVWHDNEGNFAFVEEEEIAYVCGGVGFERFAACLLTKLFAEYAMISFEADDCDPFAMQLRAMFEDAAGESFDTYLYEVT